MTDEELGRLSSNELLDRSSDHATDCSCDTCKEWDERISTHEDGKPGVSPLLSRRVVRAALGPMLHNPYPETADHSSSDITQAEWDANCVVHACARALLALPPDASSPLEDE